MMKKLLLALGAIALMGGSLTVAYSAQSPMPVNAEGETSEVEASVDYEETGESTIKETYDKVVAWAKDTVMPIFGGISVLSLVGMVVSIATAFAKMKGDKANRAVIIAQDEVVAKLKAQVEELKAELGEQSKFENEILENYKATLLETSATMAQVANYAKTTAELVESQNHKIAKVEKMKNTIEVSCDLVAKSLALSEVAVKSGIAQDAQKLVANLKEVNKDGGED